MARRRRLPFCALSTCARPVRAPPLPAVQRPRHPKKKKPGPRPSRRYIPPSAGSPIRSRARDPPSFSSGPRVRRSSRRVTPSPPSSTYCFPACSSFSLPRRFHGLPSRSRGPRRPPPPAPPDAFLPGALPLRLPRRRARPRGRRSPRRAERRPHRPLGRSHAASTVPVGRAPAAASTPGVSPRAAPSPPRASRRRPFRRGPAGLLPPCAPSRSSLLGSLLFPLPLLSSTAPLSLPAACAAGRRRRAGWRAPGAWPPLGGPPGRPASPRSGRARPVGGHSPRPPPPPGPTPRRSLSARPPRRFAFGRLRPGPRGRGPCKPRLPPPSLTPHPPPSPAPLHRAPPPFPGPLRPFFFPPPLPAPVPPRCRPPCLPHALGSSPPAPSPAGRRPPPRTRPAASAGPAARRRRSPRPHSPTQVAASPRRSFLHLAVPPFRPSAVFAPQPLLAGLLAPFTPPSSPAPPSAGRGRPPAARSPHPRRAGTVPPVWRPPSLPPGRPPPAPSPPPGRSARPPLRFPLPAPFPPPGPFASSVAAAPPARPVRPSPAGPSARPRGRRRVPPRPSHIRSVPSLRASPLGQARRTHSPHLAPQASPSSPRGPPVRRPSPAPRPASRVPPVPAPRCGCPARPPAPGRSRPVPSVSRYRPPRPATAPRSAAPPPPSASLRPG